ncbi:MAG: hypothetical protein ACOC2W_00580 [bacterium]
MSFTSMIDRVKGQFQRATNNREMPDVFNRYMGGEYRQNQPFVTGYHQVLFSLPEKLFDTSPDDAQKWLTSTCESFTPHTVTPNFVDVMGAGQLGASFFTSKTIGREFTMGFREYQQLPIINIVDAWHSVFDEHTGSSPLLGNEYVQSNYKGSCVVFQLKPTGARNDILTADDVEELYFYQGVWPKTNPRDTAGASDQTTNEFIQLSITFSFDGAPLTMKDGILEKCLTRLNGIGAYKQSYSKSINVANGTVND